MFYQPSSKFNFPGDDALNQFMYQRKLSKGQTAQLKQQKMIAEFRKRVRDLKCEVTEKET